MNQIALTLPEARARRDAGMAQALDHAESVDAGWAEAAFGALVQYALTHGSFTSEQFRAGSKLDIPTTAKALGPVFRRAARERVIEKGGYVQSTERHCSPIPLWHSLVLEHAA